MTKDQFDELFIKAKTMHSPQSEQEMLSRMAQYTNDTSHMKLEEVVAYVQMECIKYTNDLIYTMLYAIAVDEQ